MITILVDNKVYLCDKCNANPAQYYVEGLSTLSLYDGLCSKCCADYLNAKGDTIGADKFNLEVD